MMGRVWSVDAVAKNTSTSLYGNVVSLAESPRKEGLLYVGTDDGLVQVTEDGGTTWRKVETFPGVPASTYVAGLSPSPHDDVTVYAAFDNHKMGDFKPYLLKSGLPTIAVKDIAIQKREGDLVLATFGRGFYVLDDLTPIRKATDALLAKEAALLPVKTAWMFIPAKPLGLRDKAFQGESFFTAPNPPFGAVITYYLKDELKTKKKARLAADDPPDRH